MGLRTVQLATLTFEQVELPASALLGDGNFDLQRFLDLSRIGLCALAVGTCQGILDYVTEYCNERVAFGEPISHRQSVAFMIADIAIELEAMRLMTWRAASRAEQRPGLPRTGLPGQAVLRRTRHENRHRRRAIAGRARLLPGAPGGNVVPQPARHRHSRRRRQRLAHYQSRSKPMINLELSDKHQETYNNLRMVAEHMMRPYSRKYDKEEHSYPKELEEVAKLLDGGRAGCDRRQSSARAAARNGGNLLAVSGL